MSRMPSEEARGPPSASSQRDVSKSYQPNTHLSPPTEQSSEMSMKIMYKESDVHVVYLYLYVYCWTCAYICIFTCSSKHI